MAKKRKVEKKAVRDVQQIELGKNETIIWQEYKNPYKCLYNYHKPEIMISLGYFFFVFLLDMANWNRFMKGEDIFIAIIFNGILLTMAFYCSNEAILDLLRIDKYRNICDVITNKKIISNNEISCEEMTIQTVESVNFTKYPLSKKGTITFKSKRKHITFYDVKDVINTYSTISLNIDNIKGTK